MAGPEVHVHRRPFPVRPGRPEALGRSPGRCQSSTTPPPRRRALELIAPRFFASFSPLTPLLKDHIVRVFHGYASSTGLRAQRLGLSGPLRVKLLTAAVSRSRIAL